MTQPIPVIPPPRPGSGNSTHPPRWLPKALFMVVFTVFAAIFVWRVLGSLQTVGMYLLLSFLISLALEPVVLWLVRHKWKRSRAAMVSLGGFIVFSLVLIGLFGQLMVQQLIEFSKQVPVIWQTIRTTASDRFNIDIPADKDLVSEVVSRWSDDMTSGALAVGAGVFTTLFATMAILLITYYLLAAGPKFRATICQFLPRDQQNTVLRLWEITQDKVSGFISTRLILALVNSLATFAFLTILRTPYSVPLALFTGLISQFVPTIGTYIGGALPVLVALAGQGPMYALGILIFIITYQQIENLWLQPKISAKALEMNPAVAFIVVIAFGSVFGAIGAFVGLPIAAIIQAALSTYLQRHELVENELLHDPSQTGPVRVRKNLEDEPDETAPQDDSTDENADPQ